MMNKLVVVSALCAGTALAQVESGAACTSSQNQQFQYCLRDFALDIDIYWNYQPPNVQFLYEAPANGWHSIGFSSGDAGFSMVPSNLVIGCIDENVLGDYEVFGGRVAPVLSNNQGLAGLQQNIANGICSVEFTRPIDAQVEISNDNQILGDRFQRTIVARGGNVLAQHGNQASDRMSFSVNYAIGVGAASTLSASTTLVAGVLFTALFSLFQ